MGFLKKVKLMDSATGLEVGKSFGSNPTNITPKNKFRNKRIYCMRGHRVKITGKYKGDFSVMKFKCQSCGILNENQVTTVG